MAAMVGPLLSFSVCVRHFFNLEGCVQKMRIKMTPLLARKSHHCFIHPTTFVMVSIVLLVGIVRVQIWYLKP
jgi:hypothetical protein